MNIAVPTGDLVAASTVIVSALRTWTRGLLAPDGTASSADPLDEQSATSPTDWMTNAPRDPVSAARAHKQQVRAAATQKAARLTLLFLTWDEGPLHRDQETELVAAAWTVAKRELGHTEFVQACPATFADLHALAG